MYVENPLAWKAAVAMSDYSAEQDGDESFYDLATTGIEAIISDIESRPASVSGEAGYWWLRFVDYLRGELDG